MVHLAEQDCLLSIILFGVSKQLSRLHFIIRRNSMPGTSQVFQDPFCYQNQPHNWETTHKDVREDCQE
jgi:hypothetical protein